MIQHKDYFILVFVLTNAQLSLRYGPANADVTLLLITFSNVVSRDGNSRKPIKALHSFLNRMQIAPFPVQG